MSEKKTAAQKVRDLFAAQIVSEMSPMQINGTFQALHDENQQLKAKVAELERERDEFCQMIIDAESAEPNVRASMYPVFLHKAKLRKGAGDDN